MNTVWIKIWMWDGGRVVVGISLQRRQPPEFLKRINPKFMHFYNSTPIFRESLHSSLTVILNQHCETQTQFFKQLISKQGSKWCTGNQTYGNNSHGLLNKWPEDLKIKNPQRFWFFPLWMFLELEVTSKTLKKKHIAILLVIWNIICKISMMMSCWEQKCLLKS